MRELDYKESWVLKNWCIKLWCWKRLLRVPWTARRSNQSILKEIGPGCSLEGLVLKQKAESRRIHAFELWCWRRLLRVPWTAEIQLVHPKGDQSWVFIGRTDAEAETPIVWPPDVKNWFIWKDPVTWKDWGQEEKGTTRWDGWMASSAQWTWVWVDSRSW